MEGERDIGAKQKRSAGSAREGYTRRRNPGPGLSWVEATVWNERMLAALVRRRQRRPMV